jgi:MFS family permease
VLGVIGLAAVPLALTLPREIAAGHAEAGRGGTRWRPSTLNVLYFMLSAIEGAFATTLSLLFAGTTSVASAVLAAGLVLALQRITIVVLSLVAGPLIDRIGARNLLAPCVVVIVAGLLGIAHGAVYVSAIVVVLARAVLGTAGPVLATQEREGSTVERLAAFATWVDSGLAVGPLVGGVFVARFGMAALYDVLAVGIVAALTIHLIARRRAGLGV